MRLDLKEAPSILWFGKTNLSVVALGRCPYQRGWDIQKELFEKRIEQKIPNILILCEHPPTITLGRGAFREHLLISEEELKREGGSLFTTDRGGEITYHGPGQLVGYPIIDLKEYRMDLHWYLRQLEEVLILVVAHFGLKGERVKNVTGVWVNGEKIASIGIKTRSWVTMHGFSLNVDPNLEHFGWIVPCGISDRGVTSMGRLCKRVPSIEEVSQKVVWAFGQVL